MLISFIVPIYNQFKEINFIIKNLETLARSVDCEIIVVDDCSDDGTYNFLNNKSLFKKIKIYKTSKNSGPGFARNLGISLSKAQYISFLDSDDFLELNVNNTNYVDSLVAINNELADVILMSCNIESRGYFSPRGLPKLPEVLTENLNTKLSYTVFPAKECWGVLFNANFLKSENIQFPCVRLAEDQVFMTEVRIKIKSISSTDLFTYTHTANIQAYQLSLNAMGSLITLNA